MNAHLAMRPSNSMRHSDKPAACEPMSSTNVGGVAEFLAAVPADSASRLSLPYSNPKICAVRHTPFLEPPARQRSIEILESAIARQDVGCASVRNGGRSCACCGEYQAAVSSSSPLSAHWAKERPYQARPAGVTQPCRKDTLAGAQKPSCRSQDLSNHESRQCA